MTSSISLNVSTVNGWLYKHNNIQEISGFISGTARYICSDCSHSSINSFPQITYITDIKSSSAEYGTGDQGNWFNPTNPSIRKPSIQNMLNL